MSVMDVPNKVIREQKIESKGVLENKNNMIRTSTWSVNIYQTQSKNLTTKWANTKTKQFSCYQKGYKNRI